MISVFFYDPAHPLNVNSTPSTSRLPSQMPQQPTQTILNQSNFITKIFECELFIINQANKA